ncbi:pilus assembly protein [Xanthomonas sp. Kuri4-1]
MSSSPRPRSPGLQNAPARQSGAVLYVALIMLILLALLGIVGMQVTGLQEKMSSNYRAANLAFQNAEQLVRITECGVEDTVNRTTTTGCSASSDVKVCDEAFDVGDWADAIARARTGKSTNIRLIGPCISGNSSLAMGSAVNEDANPIYQISGYQTDQSDNASADAAIDTIFRP